jgi:hypothetical protein
LHKTILNPLKSCKLAFVTPTATQLCNRKSLFMNKYIDLTAYHQSLLPNDRGICELLCNTINENLNYTENKIWHGHPVWFIDGNPIVGYSKQKNGVRMMFWSGADFEEEKLSIKGEKFKDASIFYNSEDEIYQDDLMRWLIKAENIQWDYKNIIKRKGQLLRLK